MKIADLAKAQAAAGERAANAAMRDRLMSGERLALMIGQGGDAREIVLSASYLARLRGELVAAFQGRLAENDAALADLGVEP